jgi:uncharacterized repeat protein (TIGR03843 family)
MPGDERAPRVTLAGDAEIRLLQRGELRILGLLPRSSNYTFLAEVAADSEEVLAVYKPRAGEAPLWDFPEGTLGLREVAAYRVAQELGWPRVPPTLYREGPEGPGSVQLFVEFDVQQHYFTLLRGREDVFRRVALFDAVVNNADRKGGHCLLAADEGVFVIDHGVCFSATPKLRTVIWEFAGEPIDDDLLGDLHRVRAGLGAGGELRAQLVPLLRSQEIEAIERRLAALLDAPRFPEPAGERPYPWPAI